MVLDSFVVFVLLMRSLAFAREDIEKLYACRATNFFSF